LPRGRGATDLAPRLLVHRDVKLAPLFLLGLAACHTHAEGPLPDAAAGVGVDSAAAPDAAVSTPRCAVLGCAPVPACPATCQSECGCCGCTPGLRFCAGNAVQTCGASGACFEYTQCPAEGDCVEYGLGQAACATSSADCGRIEAAYRLEARRYALVTADPGGGSPTMVPDRRCAPGGCTVTAGHCAIGLGACWYLGTLDPEVLDRFAKLWQRLGCTQAATCACPPLPPAADCTPAGACVGR
jgi:hypothetical protein